MPEHGSIHPDQAFHPGRSIGPAVFAMMKESRARQGALASGDEMESVHRGNQEPDRVYVRTGDEAAFVSPDGEGRYWYDTPHQAFDQHGVLPVTYVDQVHEHHGPDSYDWDQYEDEDGTTPYGDQDNDYLR